MEDFAGKLDRYNDYKICKMLIESFQSGITPIQMTAL
jgi:hypothetical protein